MNVLGQNIAQYEQAFGTLNLEPQSQSFPAWTSELNRQGPGQRSGLEPQGANCCASEESLLHGWMRRCRSGWSFRSSLWRSTLSHFTLLRLPYYWDEAGYYIPAAWDFFRTGSLIPTSTLTNAHPPLPSIYLALCWKASGFHPEVTREAVLLVATLGLLAVWRLAMRLVGVASVAFWTVLLTGLYPIWFAQSSLAHADIFAAACSLWGLVYALPNRGRTLWACRVVVCRRRAFKGDGDRDSADPGRGKRGRGIQERRTGALAGSGARPHGSRVACCPWPRGTHTTTRRPGFSSAIRSFSATTRRPRSRRCEFWRRSGIASCT